MSEWIYLDIVDKYNKHQVLLECERIKKHLPDMAWFGKKSLKRFLEKYQNVYLKPSRGGGGNGIIKVQRKKSQEGWVYSFHYRKKEKWFSDYLKLYQALKRKINRINKNDKRYLIQQGIQLLTYQECSFDIRSFVQLNEPLNYFDYRGSFVRVGAPNKIVTNLAKGGKVVNLEKVLSSLMSIDEVKNIQQTLETISLEMVSLLRDKCSQIVEAGLDFGLDQEMNLWLIEVNLEPRFKGFKKVDIDVYNQIASTSRMLRQSL